MRSTTSRRILAITPGIIDDPTNVAARKRRNGQILHEDGMSISILS